MKHEKAPTAPRFEGGIDYLVYAHGLENHSFRAIWPTSSGQNCHKAHLQAKTFHMSLFPGLYDHPLQRNSLEKLMFRKPLFLDILAKFGLEKNR